MRNNTNSPGMVLNDLRQDVRYSARMLRKNPGFAAVAILTLALGIGANAAIFSVIYGVLLRPLPYRDGNHLVVLKQQQLLARTNDIRFSVKDIQDYRQQAQTLESVVEHHSMNFLLLDGQEAVRVQTGVVSANFFDVLGIKPLHGRTFIESDEQHSSDAVIVLSHKHWLQAHKGDPNVIGSVFRMNNRPHTVIGVLPPIPQYPTEEDVYMPTSHCPFRSAENFINNRTSRMMTAFARVKTGVSIEQARADLSRVAGNLQKQYPDAYPANNSFALATTSLREELTRQARPTFLVLLVATVLVLLIACANVANLMLARMMQREREMAIRAAMGADRKRLIRQMLTESTLLALVGGVGGLLLAVGGIQLLVKFAARFTPRANEIGLDSTVLLFTLLISLLTGFVFGLLPAFSAEQKLSSALKDGGGRSSASAGKRRVRNGLVVAQVAVSFVLLIGAGLMLRSFLKLQQIETGYKGDRVLLMRISPNWSKYNTTDLNRDFWRRMLERVSSQSGVLMAATSSSFPLNPLAIRNGPFGAAFTIEGRPQPPGETAPQLDFQVASTDYFQTIGVPLLSGRYFTERDDRDTESVAIINRAAAQNRWRGEDPIGRRVSFNNGRTWLKIVGIVGDVKSYGLDREANEQLFVPLKQSGNSGYLLVRTAAEPMSLAAGLRNAIHEVDAETAVDRVQTLEFAREEYLASPQLTAVLIALFAGLALLITSAGISGVMALAVNQRTHELGVRLALGATPAKVLWLVMRQGMLLTVAGLAIGLLGALALSRFVQSLLFSTAPDDPMTFVAVSGILLAVAAVACFVPARKVTEIDPMIALRSE